MTPRTGLRNCNTAEPRFSRDLVGTLSPMNIGLRRLLIGLVLMTGAGASEQRAVTEARWWKGNLHTHTLWSDGDGFPEMVVEWYRNAGYHFLALSDHNVLSQGQRWMTLAAVTAKAKGEPWRGAAHVPRDAYAEYLKRFGPNWVETRPGREAGSVEVRLKPPRIPYRETITAATEAHGRHRKQSGGHGQFGDCKIKVEPLPRGSDFEFVIDIFGGSIPRQFIPAIEKGIQDARTRGYLAGYPMVDCRATVFDGSFHAVDSNELSFKMAGSLAFKDAMTRAQPTLLEPVMHVEVYAPSDFAGDLMGDLNSRRGHIDGMETRGSTTVIKARVPMSEMLTYEQHLTSATGGRGSHHMEYSHYAEVPHALQTRIIAHAKAERGHGQALEEDA